MPGSATVIINSNPVANSGSNISIPNGSFTVLNGSATGGTGNYNYNWSPSNMVVNANIPDPQTVNLSASQVYTLLVTDAITGCTSTSLVSVFVTGSPFSVITSTSLPTPDICLGNSTQLICTPTGGTGNYTYSWVSSPTGFTSSTQNPIVSPTSTTTYTVTVSDGFNNATSSVMVTVYSLPIANAGSNVSICNGTSTTLNASGGTSYSWSPGTGLSSTTGANPVSSPTTSTTYIVTVTNNNGCTATADVNVSVFSQVPANAGPAQTICDGQEAFLNSSGGVVFNWSPSTGLSSITISNPVATPTSTTTYTVVTTDGNGCTSSSDVVITVKPGVTANAGTDTSICLGASANLFASGGIIYSWSPANGLNSVSISNPIATPQYTTTYVVTVSNSSGCSATDAVTVNIVAAPTTTVSPNTTICSGANVTLNATGGTTYSWSPAASLNATNIPDPIAYPASTTTYTVTVTGSAGCFATNNVTITVNQSPNVNIGNPVTICNTQSTTLSASGGAVYTWSNGANTATNIVSPSSTTLYTVTVSNANGCSVKDTITVSVKPYQLPVITADGPTTFCNGAPVNVVLDANSGFTSYMWSNGSTGQSLNVTSAGLYYVTGNTANGCSGKSNTISVNSYPASTVPVVITADGTTKFCEGDTISVNLYTTSSYFAYAWSSGSNTPAIHVTHAGYYQLTVSDSNGCPDTSNIIQVQFLPKPVAYINYNQHGTFVTFANYSINTTSYFWSFGDGITSMLPSPTHTYDSTGIYHVIFVATNVCGSDTIKLTLNISTGEGIVPNNFVRNLIVFPVPTKDILTVSFDFSSTQNVEIKMLNTLGQLLYDETPISITGKYEKVFDMSSYSKGVYYLQIKTNKGIVNKEIVVD
jgi:hypothetical protein